MGESSLMLMFVNYFYWIFVFIVTVNTKYFVGQEANKTHIHLEEKDFHSEIVYNTSIIAVHWKIGVTADETPDLLLLVDHEIITEPSEKYDYNITLTDIFLKISNASEEDLNTVFHLFANDSSNSKKMSLSFHVNDTTVVEIESITYDDEGHAIAKCIVNSIYVTTAYWVHEIQKQDSVYQIVPAPVNKMGLQTTSVLKLPITTAIYYCKANSSKPEQASEIVDMMAFNSEVEIFEISDTGYSRKRIQYVNNKKSRLVVEHNTKKVRLVCAASADKYTDKVRWAQSRLENEFNDVGVRGRYAVYSYLRKLELSDAVAGTYFCKAWDKNGTLNFKQIDIEYTSFFKSIQFIISAVLLIVSLIGVGIFVMIKVRQYRKVKEELHELYKMGLAEFGKGDLGHLNPNLSVDDQVDLLPYDKSFEFPIENLIIGEQIGSGAFGVVLKGEAKGLFGGDEVTPVAVKMVNRNFGDSNIKDLASEVKIMIYLEKHVNIVNLLGACTKNVVKKELLVIVEYCDLGNLRNYILNHKEEFVNQKDVEKDKIDFLIGGDLSEGSEFFTDLPKTSNMQNLRETIEQSKNSKPMCTKDLLVWSFQVARGMEYLSSKKVVHGDLAARNILLNSDNVVKICDFGLSRKMYQSDIYRKTSNDMLPVKWMSVESIVDRVFSVQSDVWSFGIVLWEFFSLARTPYPGLEFNEEFCEKLLSGYRMKIPEYATTYLYEIMLQCWDIKPAKRPSFSELSTTIGFILEEPVRNYYVGMNDGYVKMNLYKSEHSQEGYLPIKKCLFPSYVNTDSINLNT